MVTTIIPTIGRDTLYTRAIPSVQAQTVADWRCIIVGDGVDVTPPDDPRFTVLRIDREPQTWRNGGTRAFNHGLRQVTTEWFSYLADDDEYLPNHHADLLAASRNADVVYGLSRTPGRTGIYGEHWPADPWDICQGAYIMRTAERVFADEHPASRSWDYNWWRTVIDAGKRIEQARIVVHRYHPNPETRALHGQ